MFGENGFGHFYKVSLGIEQSYSGIGMIPSIVQKLNTLFM
jgi:hypothetical protein